MPFSFVTAYFEFDDSKNEFYFNQFQKLIDTKFPIILYLDKKLSSKLVELSNYKNVKTILYDWNDLYINKLFTVDQLNSFNIPLKKDNSKDNIKFLTLMNSKSYFLNLALEQTPSTVDTLVWIDFGIFKITNDIEHFKTNFSKLKKQDKVLIPGGFRSKKLLSDQELIDSVYWRFLGGLIVAPREKVTIFNDANNIELLKLLKNQMMTWEVNIWANVEINNPELIKYFRADHNKTMFGFYDKKIILASMIKNEEKIIRRCVDSVLNICDAICINDTGSTDNTIQVVNDMAIDLNNKNVPCKLYQNPFVDFGKSRTTSYNNTVEFCSELGWDSDNTWGLLIDADMKLIVEPKFNKQTMHHNGYKIIQDTGDLDYHNTRFIKLNGSWKCVGVTHEYWDGPDLGDLTKDTIFIRDIGDGGCKDDKFARDMRLLIKGIEDEPNNGRYHFYLAQTLKDSNKHQEAIKLYKKRIEIGGWDEEIWYSHYMISKCYISLGNIFKAELWGNKAYELRKSRAEPLATLTTLFRERGDNFKAYHYYRLGKNIPMSGDLLFIEKNVYNFLLDYENTILHYYIYPNERVDGCKACVNYLNSHTHSENNVQSNIEFYYTRLANEGNLVQLNLPLLDNYCASSPSLLRKDGQLIMNIRYVNYRIQPDGSYMMHQNNTFNHNNDVITKNAIVYLDNNYNITTPVTNDRLFKNESVTDISSFPTRIKGLEDLRLFTFQNRIYYTATSQQFSYTNTNRIVMGIYDIDSLSYLNNKTLRPPHDTDCEKNWIPINYKDEKILFIYKWHPLQIGELDANNKLNITITHETPKFFRNYRGSSNVFEYNNQLWVITHGVKYVTPRKYYHQILVLDKETLKVLRYTVPFYFNNFTIEYCVGMHIFNNEMAIMFSQMDMNPCLLRISMDKLARYFV